MQYSLANEIAFFKMFDQNKSAAMLKSRKSASNWLAIVFLLCSITSACTMCTPMPAYLKLRGGGWFPKLGPNNEVSASSESARPADSKGAPEQSATTQQQQQESQQSLIGHAFEYAVAGSMDGIRSGVGQGVGASCVL